jgi:16S rRNA (cytidine1402-2'-O)-methyltransferase
MSRSDSDLTPQDAALPELALRKPEALLRGALYVVATPIGHLGEMSPRAVDILSRVDAILAEDTRHSSKLLRHFGIHTPLQALHAFNEAGKVDAVLARLQAGETLALVSDAGTPLLSDPGFPVVRAAREAGLTVRTVAGPSALIAALSVAGLPVDRFAFEGFLPAKAAARRAHLQTLTQETRTLVFYESPHRLLEMLADLIAVFGAEREGFVARELTKSFEDVKLAPLSELLRWVEDDPEQPRGEYVLGVQGAPAQDKDEAFARKLFARLSQELPPSRAAKLVAELTGVPRNAVYAWATDEKL